MAAERQLRLPELALVSGPAEDKPETPSALDEAAAEGAPLLDSDTLPAALNETRLTMGAPADALELELALARDRAMKMAARRRRRSTSTPPPQAPTAAPMTTEEEEGEVVEEGVEGVEEVEEVKEVGEPAPELEGQVYERPRTKGGRVGGGGAEAQERQEARVQLAGKVVAGQGEGLEGAGGCQVAQSGGDAP